MDEKTQNYVNGLISMLTRQRNQALDVNAKLQAELDVLRAETAAQNKEGKRAAQIERGGRIASQQPYLERTILDPIKPLMAPKARGPGFVGIASSVLGGVQTGFSTASAIKGSGYQFGKGKPGSTTKSAKELRDKKKGALNI